MLPREHGAYGQLIFPLVTALAIGRPGAAAFALAAAAVSAFLAHEPLLVLLGQRGGRARREQGRRAWRWLVPSVAGAVVFALAAFPLLPPTARLALGASAALALVAGVVIVIGGEHTAGGEILAALILSSIAWPVALAARAPMRAAVTCAATFAAVFVAASVTVRAVIAWTRKPPALRSRRMAAAVTVAAVVCLNGLWRIGYAELAGVWCALPVCVVTLVLAVVPPSARYLRRVGWTLVAATAVSAVGLFVALH